tara:strand:- start:2108 stop:2269 length:162 start_codon:yes stop_codon:yes gene_type:complete
MGLEKFIIMQKGYQELYTEITEIFKDNEKVEVVLDRRINKDNSNYRHKECLFQ